jgi:protein-S-isoprenylcysteine O-methyltransferase Ste14
MSTWFGQAAALAFALLVGLITSGLLKRMSKEDDALRSTFGLEWDEWAKNVRWQLVPGLF